jgi:hypothetical protein
MMLQRWYRLVIRSWLIITLPIFLLINILLYQHPFLAALMLWWLLPIFDRIPLHILSRTLFGEVVTSRSLLQQWVRIFIPHLIKSLTWYRLDFARSYNLPVWQLERLAGRKRSQRAKVLNKSQASTASGLSFLCLCIEVVIFVSLFGLVMMFLPDSHAHKMMAALFQGDRVWWAGPLVNTFLYITFMIVEPFYVAGGFALYINRRTELEGWDIEITFRQLAQRITTAGQALLLVLCALALFQFSGFIGAPSALAAEDTQMSATEQSIVSNELAKKTITEIMKGKDFQGKKKVAGWYPKVKTKHTPDSSPVNLSWLQLIGNTLAQLGQLLLWLAVAALIVTAIYFFVKWMPMGSARTKQRGTAQAAPKSLFGLDITPDSLPDDVAATALAMWQAGKVIDALSLLYRGALITLVHRDGINLRGSATEGDCLRILAGHAQTIAQPTRQFFQLLTRQWQYAAYAHRHPPESLMRELCDAWPQHFGVTQ